MKKIINKRAASGEWQVASEGLPGNTNKKELHHLCSSFENPAVKIIIPAILIIVMYEVEEQSDLAFKEFLPHRGILRTCQSE